MLNIDPMIAAAYPNFDNFEEELMADWTEDQKKEREVILGNRYVAMHVWET